MVLNYRCYGRWLVVGLAGLLLALSASSWPVWGQLPELTPPAPTPAAQDGSKPPPSVKRLGAVEIAPVLFLGQELFSVAAPTVLDRQNPGTQFPVEWRAALIQDSLMEILEWDQTPIAPAAAEGWTLYRSAYDYQSLQVSIARLNNQTILVVSDANHPQPLTLLTVTELDARYYNTTIEALAQRWQALVQTALVEALQRRLPEVFQRNLQRALLIFAGMTALSLALWGLQQLLRLRQKQLEALHQAEVAEIQAAQASPHRVHERDHPPGLRSQFLLSLRSRFNLERRLSLVALLQWLGAWGQVVVWAGGLFWLHSLFPETAPFIERWFTRLLTLLLIWFVVGLLNRVGSMAINRLAKAWEDKQFLLLEDDQRRSLRIPTIVRALKGFKTFAVYLFGLGWALSILGVSLSSVLTLSAVFALAISFASQNLVKDLVNGFLILLEDQYAIGDYVTVGTVSGLVENLNLRITQLRDVEGRLITVPNSQVSVVENWTRLWSRVNFKIAVAYEADLEKAMALVEAIAQELYADPDWRSKIMEPPQLMGVDQLGHEGMLIQLWLITRPLQQFAVRREMNRRVRLALAAAGIEVGRPQQVVVHYHQGHSYQGLGPEQNRLEDRHGDGSEPDFSRQHDLEQPSYETPRPAGQVQSPPHSTPPNGSWAVDPAAGRRADGEQPTQHSQHS